MKNSTSKWKDKEYMREYGKKWREAKRSEGGVSISSVPSPTEPGQPSKWKQKQDEKKAREEQKKAHPLGLEQCPFCGAAFFRKLAGKMEPIKMDQCTACEIRFYFFKGVKQ